MRKKALTVTVILLVYSFCTSLHAITHFNDGNHHVINYYLDDYVWVDVGAPGAQTHLEITTGGQLTKDFQVYENGHVSLTGGTIYRLDSRGNSTALIEQGNIETSIFAQFSSSVTVENVNIGLDIYAQYDSEVYLNGGIVNRYMEAWDNGTIHMFGGEVGGHMLTYDNGTIILYGSDFLIDGIPTPYGTYASSDFSFGGGYIQGNLANNALSSTQFGLADSGQLILAPVPEPTTLLLLSLGGLALMRKRR